MTLIKPLVSIIIPTYNRAHLLGETLKSVIEQSYTNWECLIIDDGSTDDTETLVLSYLKSDARFKYFKRPDNYLSGGNGARNYGLSLAKGTYINWLDSDDLFDAKKIEFQLEALKTNQAKVNVCLGEFFNNVLGDCGGQLWSKHEEAPNEVFDALITQKMRWPSGAVLWHKDVLKENCWEASLRGAQEWLFHIKQALILNKGEVSFINQVLVYIRNSNTSITRQESLGIRYGNYLKARILLLEFLYLNYNQQFTNYFSYTYNFSLKYVKYLIAHNINKDLKLLSKLIKKTSYANYLKFNLGIVVYKFFRKDYFLKLLVINNI